MKLTVIDTPGFGDQINNENWWVELIWRPQWSHFHHCILYGFLFIKYKVAEHNSVLNQSLSFFSCCCVLWRAVSHRFGLWVNTKLASHSWTLCLLSAGCPLWSSSTTSMKPTCRRKSTSTGRRGSQTPGCTAAYTSYLPQATGKIPFSLVANNCPSFCFWFHQFLPQLQRSPDPLSAHSSSNNYILLQLSFCLSLSHVDSLSPQRHWSITWRQFS